MNHKHRQINNNRSAPNYLKVNKIKLSSIREKSVYSSYLTNEYLNEIQNKQLTFEQYLFAKLTDLRQQYAIQMTENIKYRFIDSYHTSVQYQSTNPLSVKLINVAPIEYTINEKEIDNDIYEIQSTFDSLQKQNPLITYNHKILFHISIFKSKNLFYTSYLWFKNSLFNNFSLFSDIPYVDYDITLLFSSNFVPIINKYDKNIINLHSNPLFKSKTHINLNKLPRNFIEIKLDQNVPLFSAILNENVHFRMILASSNKINEFNMINYINRSSNHKTDYFHYCLSTTNVVLYHSAKFHQKFNQDIYNNEEVNLTLFNEQMSYKYHSIAYSSEEKTIIQFVTTILPMNMYIPNYIVEAPSIMSSNYVTQELEISNSIIIANIPTKIKKFHPNSKTKCSTLNIRLKNINHEKCMKNIKLLLKNIKDKFYLSLYDKIMDNMVDVFINSTAKLMCFKSCINQINDINPILSKVYDRYLNKLELKSSINCQ